MLKNKENVSDEVKVANTLNTVSSSTVKKLKTPEKFTDHYLPHNLSRSLTLNATLKHHPSILVIKRVSQRFSSLYFSPNDENTVLKEITKLKSNKAVKDTDIPVKVLKYNADFFAKYIYLQ